MLLAGLLFVHIEGSRAVAAPPPRVGGVHSRAMCPPYGYLTGYQQVAFLGQALDDAALPWTKHNGHRYILQCRGCAATGCAWVESNAAFTCNKRDILLMHQQ